MSNTPRLTVAYIQQAVASTYGLDVRLLTSPRRARHIARPRQVAMWLAHKLLPDYSLPQIGRAFGNRDHTTIMHGIRRVEDLSDHNAAFFETLIALRNRIVDATTPASAKAVPIERQARAISHSFAKAAFALAEANPDLAAKVFRGIGANFKPVQPGEKK